MGIFCIATFIGLKCLWNDYTLYAIGTRDLEIDFLVVDSETGEGISEAGIVLRVFYEGCFPPSEKDFPQKPDLATLGVTTPGLAASPMGNGPVHAAVALFLVSLNECVEFVIRFNYLIQYRKHALHLGINDLQVRIVLVLSISLKRPLSNLCHLLPEPQNFFLTHQCSLNSSFHEPMIIY